MKKLNGTLCDFLLDAENEFEYDANVTGTLQALLEPEYEQKIV